MPKGLPSDKIPSGCGYRGWVDVTLYGKNIEHLKSKINSYFVEYPPQGYDTFITAEPRMLRARYWMAKIRRYSSCD